MNTNHTRTVSLSLGLALLLLPVRAFAQTIQDPPIGRPDAVIDLASREGVQLVDGQWRYYDVKIVDADSRAVGPDLKPSGTPIRTYDYSPHAGAVDFDDSQWEAIEATTLDQRRSTAKVCFNWYRINVTIPERVGNLSTAGSTVAFEIVIDDYAEVWVDGKMPRVLGQPGGPVIKGFNAPNRVILTRSARPGQRIQVAVFGINCAYRKLRLVLQGFLPAHVTMLHAGLRKPPPVNFDPDVADSQAPSQRRHFREPQWKNVVDRPTALRTLPRP
jgi:gluconolactonase